MRVQPCDMAANGKFVCIYYVKYFPYRHTNGESRWKCHIYVSKWIFLAGDSKILPGSSPFNYTWIKQ